MIQYRDLLSDTICAPVTPPGHSGVAVIRVSGNQAFKNTLEIIKHSSLKPETHRSYLSEVLDGEGQKIDQVLLTFFSKGKSFTGDESVEVSCHGNPLLINSIVQRFLEKGCRLAERGEFSFRAYYNGKIDLVQAESIQNLVTAKIKTGSRTFVKQLTGKLSDSFNGLQDDLVTAMAHLEASIDFVEEDIQTGDLKVVGELLNKVLIVTNQLLTSYDLGKSLNKDLKILILGNTNAGKSSLFNSCLQANRAIVTEIPGTTRDLVSGQKFLGTSSVEFIDSAGLRKTVDPVETLGIQKSLAEIESADLILFVIDLTEPGSLDILPSLPKDKVLVVFNKVDLFESEPEMMKSMNLVFNKIGMEFQENEICFVSSLTGFQIEEMLKKAESFLAKDTSEYDSGLVVTQARHFNHLLELKSYLTGAKNLISLGESPDLISQELSLGLSEVHQLLGKKYDDEVLDKIFSQFCIGK